MEPSNNLSTPNPLVFTGKKTFKQEVVEWVKVITIALIISLPIRFFIAEPFIVNGASMDPTFATGQFLLVDRLTYRFELPSRGDVVVFEYPNDPNTYYIKRIIGLPGETVNIADGVISISKINSTGTASTTATSSNETITLKEPYVQKIHRSHDTMQINLGATQYFVMGDNRAESSDSRYWGPLDKHFIVGRPIVRLYPLKKISILPGEYRE